jgi:hypothetical protein
LGFNYRGPSAAILQDEELLFASQRRIDGDGDGAQRYGPHKRRDELRRISQQDGHAISAPHAQSVQDLGSPQRFGAKVRVRKHTTLEPNRFARQMRGRK